MEQNGSLRKTERHSSTRKESVGRVGRLHGAARGATRAEQPLRGRESQIFGFIRDFITHNSYPLTIREITEGCNLSSTSVAGYHLSHLVDRGYLLRFSNIARRLVLTERGKVAALE